MKILIQLILLSIFFSCCNDDDVEKPYPDGTICADKPYLDHEIVDGACGCPEAYYQLGYDLFLSLNNGDLTDSPPYWICKRNNDYTYWLVTDCECTSATANYDTVILQFYHEGVERFGVEVDEYLAIYFPGMGGFSRYSGILVEKSNGNEWDLNVASGYMFSFEPSNDEYQCFYRLNNGRAEGKFDPSNTVSETKLYWYFIDEKVDSCNMKLIRKD